jgi:iron complex outermembrane receptor protein
LQISKIANQTSVNENFDAAIQGFEGEFAWVPDAHWRLTANLAWLDTELDGGESVDPANINLQGTTENIISSPFNNVYTGPGCPAGTPTCDGLPTILDGNELPNAPEFSVNIGIGYAWFTELWGRNLKDDDYVTGQVPGDQNVGLATNQFLLEPRTYGISAGYNF